MTGPLRQLLNETHQHFDSLMLLPETLAKLIKMVDDGKVNFSIAATKILPALLAEKSTDPLAIATRLNLLQVHDSNEIENWVNEVLAKMPDKVAEYKKGKKGLIGLFIGEVKKLSKGKADPKKSTELLEEKLNG